MNRNSHWKRVASSPTSVGNFDIFTKKNEVRALKYIYKTQMDKIIEDNV